MDPLAHRVASRYLRARGSPDALLHQTEQSVHRGQEMLRAIVQQHGFWSNAIATGKDARDIDHAYGKLQTLMDGYAKEIRGAMASLDAYEHEMADPALSDHFAARYAASSHYGPLFQQLVTVMDELDEAVKKTDHAEELLKKLEHTVKADADFKESDPKGNKQYGFQQQIDQMREALKKFNSGAGDLGWSYDELNRWALQQGLK